MKKKKENKNREYFLVRKLLLKYLLEFVSEGVVALGCRLVMKSYTRSLLGARFSSDLSSRANWMPKKKHYGLVGLTGERGYVFLLITELLLNNIF